MCNSYHTTDWQSQGTDQVTQLRAAFIIDFQSTLSDIVVSFSHLKLFQKIETVPDFQ